MNEDQTLKSLQLEFDEILTCIKPIYLNWKNAQDKIFIAGWIKKLSSMKNLTVDSMHLRNLYILALYENLRRDIVCDPFTNSPPADDLPPLSNHLKQLIEKFSTKQILGPDWLETDEKDVGFIENSVDYEEDDYIGDLKFSSDMNEMKQNVLRNMEKLHANRSIEFDHNGSAVSNIYKCQNINSDWLRQFCNQASEKESKIAGDDSQLSKINDDDTRLKNKSMDFNSFNKVQEKEMERRLIQLQNAYHEDILKLRHQNDIEIQNIINRKNVEINQIRNNYKDKLKEQEVQMQLLDSNASDCLKQLQMFQETKLKEIEQLRRIHLENSEKQIHEYEQKIANLMDDFQKENYKVTEEQKKREEIIIKESKDYFEKVKMEFSEKSTFTSRQIIDLEADITELKNTKNLIVEKNEKLKSEKEDLTNNLMKLQNDLKDSQKKYQSMESQYSRLLMAHDKEVQSLKDTLETALHKAECATDEIQATAYDKVDKLEYQIKDLQSKLQESTRSNKSEMENIISNYNAEKKRMKQTYEDEIANLKVQLKNSKSQFDSKFEDLKNKLDIKEVQLFQANKEMEMKDKSAIQIVEDLRQEMTHNSDRQLRKKQFEYDHMESELGQEIQEKTREVVDLMQQLSSHKQDTEIKLGEIRKWSDSQIATLTNDWKLEKLSLEADFQFQLTKANEEHKRNYEKLHEEKNKKIFEIQNLFDNVSRDIPILKRELYQQVQIHKKETNDLIQSSESEKSKLVEEHKSSIENLNRQTMEYKCKMEEKHAENISQILIKTNEKLKEIENEYSERSMQSFKMINDLKATTDKLKEEKFELLNSQEDLKNNFTKKHNAEIENMQKVIKSNLEAYKREISNDQAKYKNLENQIEKKEYEMKKQITGIKFEYESQLSKMMPLDVQNDYEETIQSLRSQITFLQQKNGILEDEINTVNNLKVHHNNGYSKHLCEQRYQS